MSCEMTSKNIGRFPENQECSISFHFTPRNSNHGWADWGVFKYDLSEDNVSVPFKERSYNPQEERPYIYEYYYVTKKMNPTFFLNSLSSPLDEKSGVSRILVNLCDTDTLEIDSEFRVTYRDSVYMLNDSIIGLFYDLMPADIMENWMYDINVVNAPGRIHPYEDD